MPREHDIAPDVLDEAVGTSSRAHLTASNSSFACQILGWRDHAARANWRDATRKPCQHTRCKHRVKMPRGRIETLTVGTDRATTALPF